MCSYARPPKTKLMKLYLDIDIQSPATRMQHQDGVMLVGSCFTQHIGNRLADLKFSTLQNPNGIIFDAHSVCRSIDSYIGNKPATANDLFLLNELWQSWQHHSLFSGMQQQTVLNAINSARSQAHVFLKQASWLIITLGTSFSYRLQPSGEPVANCHRAPANWFHKHLMDIAETTACLENTLEALHRFNQALKVVFTISPVRHIRDGVVENNRSKARLLEAVHQVVNKYSYACYFPAYEIVIDVLRDYRFYDADLVHPNYAATEYVFDKFVEHYIHPVTAEAFVEIKKIHASYKHKPAHPATAAHHQFIESTLAKIHRLQQTHPYLDFSREQAFFEGGG